MDRIKSNQLVIVLRIKGAFSSLRAESERSAGGEPVRWLLRRLKSRAKCKIDQGLLLDLMGLG
jgi:hypothetical protein